MKNENRNFPKQIISELAERAILEKLSGTSGFKNPGEMTRGK